MQLLFNTSFAEGYKSPSQKARKLTEAWVSENIFCPACGNAKLVVYPASHKSADFYCERCKEDFELKSKKGRFGKKLTGADYKETRRAFQSVKVPHFFFLEYSVDGLRVVNFFAVPKFYFVSKMLVKRKELSEDAERANWQGCYIPLDKIPETSKVYFVKDGQARSRDVVLRDWDAVIARCEEERALSPGWTKDVFDCILSLDRKDFTLNDAYTFEVELQRKHPENRNVRPKIRQQLQVLRDKRYLGFSPKKGMYRLA